MESTTEFRRTYLGAAPHTLVIGIIWIISGILADQTGRAQGILTLVLGGFFIFPLGELIRIGLLKAKNLLSPDNKLPQLYTLLAFTIPLSYPIIYMAYKANPNWFYPAFGIIVGAHYLPFYFGYRMKSFMAMALVLILISCYDAFYKADTFSLSAYLVGFILILFSGINYALVRKELLSG